MTTKEDELSKKQNINQQEQEWLKIKGLNKTYGNFIAVNNVNLTIKKGEFLTLLGGSGSGKTTTLLSVSGFLEPTEGEILLSGESILDTPAHKRNMGVVFQQYSLFPHMTIFENIAFPLKMRKFTKHKIQEKVRNVLKLVELEDFFDRKPSELSGGQQQRVALARALVFEPTILLMDEPLGALDKKLRTQMQLEIMHLHKKLGLTIIYVTHDQEEALVMSDRIAIFNEGNIEQLGTPKELYNYPSSLYVAEFLGSSNIFKGEVVHYNNNNITIEYGLNNQLTILTTQKFNQSKNVLIMVRPEKMEICSNLEEQPEMNQIKAKIEDFIYLGESYQYILRTDFGETVLVKNQLNSIDEKTYNIDDSVYINWDIQDTILLPSG